MVNRTSSKGRCHPSGRSAECDTTFVCTAPFCTVGSNDVFPWLMTLIGGWMIIDEYTHGTDYIFQRNESGSDLNQLMVQPCRPTWTSRTRMLGSPGWSGGWWWSLHMHVISCNVIYYIYLHINLCIIYFRIFSNTSINDSFSSTPMSLLRILDIFCISILWIGLSNIAACCWILIISRMDLPQWWRRWNDIKLTWWRSFAKSVQTWKSATRKVPQKCSKQRLPKNTSRKPKVTPVELVCMRISSDFRVS